jgi:hypothetical protein
MANKVPYKPYTVTIVDVPPEQYEEGALAYEILDLPPDGVAKVRRLEEEFGADVVLIAYRRILEEEQEAPG